MSADNSPSVSSPGSVERLSPTENESPWSSHAALKRLPSPKNNELENAVAEMRKRRELNIYSARRIFISGSNAPSDSDAPGDDEQHINANLDDLVSHTRHLNLSGISKPALDVLSPETREKIRRMQVEGQLRQLRHKEQRQTAELKQIEQARRLAERAYHRARDEAEADDPLDSLPEGVSLKSDYSTTSSVPLPGAMSVSCIDGLPGYAPSSASPSVSPQITRSTLSSATPSVCASPAFARSKPWYEVADEQEERRSLVTPLPAQSADPASTKTTEEKGKKKEDSPTTPTPTGAEKKNGSRTPLHASSSSPPSRTLTPGEKTASRISQKIRFRSKHTDRRDPRRHTLSDIEQIKAVFGATENGEAHKEGKDGSASGRSASGHTKVGKLARWFKNSFRKSSPDLLAPTADLPSSNNVVRHTSSLV